MAAAQRGIVRTFVALNLASAVRDAAHASLQPLVDRALPVRWTDAAGLHLTLKFLGDIEGAEIERLDASLRAVAQRHEPLTLQLGGLGAFPSLRRANIIWLGVAAEPALMSLQRDTELALSRLGYAREQKPFRPHITVARARNGARPPDIERLIGTHDWTTASPVETLDVMRSHLDPRGARYEPLLRIRLGQELTT
jgi:RNA 2',3'-cyclic 3'-phosphodiesterase